MANWDLHLMSAFNASGKFYGKYVVYLEKKNKKKENEKSSMPCFFNYPLNNGNLFRLLQITF